MKKCLFLIICLFTFCSPVLAAENVGVSHGYDSSHNSSSCADCALLCAYENKVKVTAEFVDPPTYDYFSAYIYYDYKTQHFSAEWISQETDISIATNFQNVDHKYVFIADDVKKSLKETGKCPTGGYIDVDTFMSAASELFFDNGGNYCQDASNWGTKFKGSSSLKYDNNTQLDTYFTNWAPSLTCEDLSSSETADVKTQLNTDIIKNYMHGLVDTVPSFILNSSGYKTGYDKLVKQYNDKKAECKKEVDDKVSSGSLTSSEAEKQKENIDKNTDAAIEQSQNYENNTDGSQVQDYGFMGLSCSSITKTIAWLQKIFNIIKIAGPLLVMGLGIYDYIQAIYSSDDDALKKANKKFMKRVIAACVIFLLPYLLEMILGLVDKFGDN